MSSPHAYWRQRLSLILNLLGAMTMALGVAMVPSLLYSYIDHSPDMPSFMASIALSLVGGGLLFLTTKRTAKTSHVGHREGFLIVGLGWLCAGLVGALPFYLYPHLAELSYCLESDASMVGAGFCSFTNAAFESISGFTTTGATIITDGLWGSPGFTPDGRVGLPRGILLWRAMTQFLGGMGLIVLGVAVLPLLGIGGMQLFKAEVPGPQADKIAPRIGQTAKLLWRIYLGLSLVCLLLLLLGGLSFYEALTHTFTTMATGGFSTRATSIASFDSAYIEWVIILFMFIGGTNFALHFFALTGRFKIYGKDAEWRAFVGIIILATTLVFFGAAVDDGTASASPGIRTSLFQVLSIITTTGFASTNFELWGDLAVMTLIGLMFVGGMAGSTSGGFKVVRHLLIFRTWTRDLFFLIHPGGIRPIRLGARIVPQDVIRAVAAFAGAYFTLFVLGAAFFCVDGQDLMTAFTCSAATLGNVGPGFGAIGPYDNFAGLSDLSKWVSCLFMLLGRLELFTLLVLLSPTFWRR
ncbi:MAG: potassium transporter [Myxococcales bacterium]|nr:potassium transporter [Myxococcales bacterium]